ncbi:MAG TPA: tyrosine-type recombinase/integrase [Asanoa sp.]
MTRRRVNPSRRGRRGHGEDSIYKDGDRWRGAVSLGYGSDGKRLRKKVSGQTREEVARKLRKLREQLDAGLPAPDDRLTVGEYLDRWLSVNLPGQVAPSTLDDYGDTVRLHLRRTLGRKKLTKLTVSDCDLLWKTKREQGYSTNSVRIMRTVLRKALGQAEKEGLVLRNVAGLSAAPRVAAKEGRTLSPTQARTLLAAVRGERKEALITIMLAFGLRRGEALGLHWNRLNWTVGTLLVSHSVKRIKERDPAQRSGRRTRLVVSELKTRRSRRNLYLTPQVVELLRRHQAQQADERLAAGEGWQDHGLIFPSEVGTPLDPDNFSHRLSTVCKRAGLGHWHPHELRHSGASLMLAQDPAACCFRGPRSRLDRHHQGRVRASDGG